MAFEGVRNANEATCLALIHDRPWEHYRRPVRVTNHPPHPPAAVNQRGRSLSDRLPSPSCSVTRFYIARAISSTWTACHSAVALPAQLQLLRAHPSLSLMHGRRLIQEMKLRTGTKAARSSMRGFQPIIIPQDIEQWAQMASTAGQSIAETAA